MNEFEIYLKSDNIDTQEAYLDMIAEGVTFAVSASQGSEFIFDYHVKIIIHHAKRNHSFYRSVGDSNINTEFRDSAYDSIESFAFMSFHHAAAFYLEKIPFRFLCNPFKAG